MLYDFIVVGILLILLRQTFIRLTRSKNGEPEGFFQHLKKWIAIFYLKIVQQREKRFMNHDLYSTNPRCNGVLPSNIEETVEKPRTLQSDKNAMDGLRFDGSDSKGNRVFIHLARRHYRCTEVWLYLRLANGDEYQLPLQPNSTVFNTDDKTFSGGGLRIETLVPMRKWRVTFNGLLRKGVRLTCGDESCDTIHVRFNFIWTPILRPRDFNYDINFNLLGNAMALEPWNMDFFQNFHFNDCYDQWGQLIGTLRIEGKDEVELHLRGLKRRIYGVLDWSSCEKYISYEVYTEDGHAFFLNEENSQSGLRRLMNGYVIRPNDFLYVFDSIDFDSFEKQGVPEYSVVHCRSGEWNYTLKIKTERNGFVAYGGEKWNTKIQVGTTSVEMGNKTGRGFIEFGFRDSGGCPVPIQRSVPHLQDDIGINSCGEYSVSFHDVQCKSSKIVGGKGMSLALLTSINDSRKFTIPRGICVTVTAFFKYLENNKHIQEAINSLEKVAWKITEGDLKDECKRVVDLVSNTSISNEIKEQVRRTLMKTFGNDYLSVKFAVRSSAVGEDSEELSAAGQNDTYLGILGEEMLWKSLAKCWASQFAFIAVEYKRQHGQLLNEGMGVVIQEMVSPDFAGVLFTHDPATGNPGLMTITANYGLGESVVSAAADPDTTVLRRTWDNRLSVFEGHKGRKAVKFIMKDGGGIEEITQENSGEEFCVSNDIALRLGEIGIYIEHAFGGPRDIEWAVVNNEIFLLQARPITSFHIETEFEIIHELDSPVLTDTDYFTRGNTGEVLPGATTPLSLSMMLDVMNVPSSILAKNLIYGFQRDPYFSKGIPAYFGHVFISFDELLRGHVTKKGIGPIMRAFELGLVGHKVIDERLQKQVFERFGEPPFLSFLKQIRGLYTYLFQLDSYLQMSHKSCSAFSLNCEDISHSKDLINEIMDSFARQNECFMAHFVTTGGSSLYNMLILNVVTKNSEEWSADNMSDLALLLRSCDEVISADVPTAITNLGAAIAKDDNAQAFRAMNPEEGLNWLVSHTGESGQKFKEFMERHGHRCVKEFDLVAVPWGDDPRSLINILQKISVNSNIVKPKSDLTPSEVISGLKTPLNSLQRWFLSIVLSRSQKAVGCREHTKSNVIKITNHFRRAYRKLASLMVNEGRIPSADLIFFFSLYEIEQLLQTRSPRLISKAIRRKHIYPKLEALKFPEIIVGFPKPIDIANNISTVASDVIIKAIPASQGTVTGVVRVVIELDDADKIQLGDILITYSTDIGWSPYFSLLSGVVTEIGGLISHGAVVAREYGLPCIVGAVGATKLFKSGEMATLNATSGFLQKLTSPHLV